MTGEAGALAVVNRFALLNDLRGIDRGLVSARASASLSAGTLGCIICRSIAPAGLEVAITITTNVEQILLHHSVPSSIEQYGRHRGIVDSSTARNNTCRHVVLRYGFESR